MARTKGAKDKRPRRPARTAVKKTTRTVATQKTPDVTQKAARKNHSATPPARTDPTPAAAVNSVDEFNAAITAELSGRALPCDQAKPADVGGSTETPPAGLANQEALLTREAWEGVCRVPFRTLGLILAWLRIVPDPQPIAAVGTRRAKDLARPSYVIFDHYAKRYMDLNPDDPVSLAIAATGLVAADIAEELTEVIVIQRQLAKQNAGTTGPE
jgi:hypothetical protein